jgi:hypothetical protein
MSQCKTGALKGLGRTVARRTSRRWWREGLRRRCAIFSASAVILAAASGDKRALAAKANALPNAALEYEVKAAFLFRFAQFVEWPANTFRETSEPFTYCTVGDDPFHGALERTLSGKTIGQRPLRVEHLDGGGKISKCQVLFVGAPADRKHVSETLATAGTLPILTVGEAEQFAENGGAIGFCTEDSKIRFEVNLDAAGKAGLKISAKLLALAKTVLGAPKGT